LLIVGGSKVPREYYEIANCNVAVGNQPHSEVAAISIVLYLLDSNQLNKDFEHSLIKIDPDSKIKKVINL
jgi:tRNA (cytidine56-2'-O)-methyltransferase